MGPVRRVVGHSALLTALERREELRFQSLGTGRGDLVLRGRRLGVVVVVGGYCGLLVL